MSYSSRVYRQRNAHSNDEGSKDAFFSKKSEPDSPESENPMFQARPAVQRLSASAEDEKTNADPRMEKDKAIQTKPGDIEEKEPGKDTQTGDPKEKKDKKKPGTDAQ